MLLGSTPERDEKSLRSRNGDSGSEHGHILYGRSCPFCGLTPEGTQRSVFKAGGK